MIEGKSALLALWLVVLITCCAAPFGLLISRASKALPARLAPSALSVTVLFGAATLLMLRVLVSPPAATSPLVLSLAFVVPLLRARPGGLTALGGLAALPLIAPVTWWEPDMALGLPQSVAFLIVGVLAAALPRLPFRATGIPAAPVLATLLALAAIAALLMGQFDSPLRFWLIWHHWGAYDRPGRGHVGRRRAFPRISGAIRDGANPPDLRIGQEGSLVRALPGRPRFPTRSDPLALAASRGFGAEKISPRAGAARHPRHRMRGSALDRISAREFRSDVGAVRPWMSFCHSRCSSSPFCWRGRGPSSHGPWLRGSALQLGLVARSGGLCDDRLASLSRAAGSAETGRGQALARRMGRSARGGNRFSISGSGHCDPHADVRVGFGDWPSASGFLTYIRNPPGILPPNPLGPIWLALATMGIGAAALTRADARGLRTGTAVFWDSLQPVHIILAAAMITMCLNLFPFVVLLIAAALSVPLPPMLEGFSRMVLVGIVAWPATFGFQSSIVSTESDGAIAIGPERLLDRFKLVTPDFWALLDAALAGQPGRHAASADAGAALAWLAEHGAGPPLVINQAMLLPRYAGGPEWTGVNNLANFDLLPREVIARFIQNGAASYNRQGWLLVDREQPGDWLELFGSAYEVAEERAFGGYSAYRLIPK